MDGRNQYDCFSPSTQKILKFKAFKAPENEAQSEKFSVMWNIQDNLNVIKTADHTDSRLPSMGVA